MDKYFVNINLVTGTLAILKDKLRDIKAENLPYYINVRDVLIPDKGSGYQYQFNYIFYETKEEKKSPFYTKQFVRGHIDNRSEYKDLAESEIDAIYDAINKRYCSLSEFFVIQRMSPHEILIDRNKNGS